MAYVINKSDGTALLTLEDATVDNSTSITLVGRNYIGYGEAQNENFLFLLENFANTSAPARPIAGQLWFDTTNRTVNVYDGDKWVEAGAAALSATPPPAPPLGAFWLKTPYNTLHVWNGTDWGLIGPEVAEGFGLTRARSTTLLDDVNTQHPVIILTVNGTEIGIISNTAFTINSSNAISGFGTLQAGLTMSTAHTFAGELSGNATTATRLKNVRLINGISFNGTQDITIKSSTTNKLESGDHIIGSDFDGGTAVRWDIDATSNNTVGKIVARDSAGDFSAGTITADLIGDVTGNVTASSGISTFDEVQATRFIGQSLSGNAATATKLRNTVNINGVQFDGSVDITVPASARTLTDTHLANAVVTSNLSTVGTLTSLAVTGNVVVNSNLTISSAGGTQSELSATRNLIITADDGSDTTQLKVIAPDVSVLDGTGPNGALVPVTTGDVDLGKTTNKFDNVHANTFIGDLTGNADTATLATTATNIAGGAAGSFAYQTASGATSLLPAGTAGQVLHTSGTGGAPYWDAPSLQAHEIGNYLVGSDYDGLGATRWDVDATSANTADKVVARDSSGNFAAGTITANLTGNVTGNTNGTHTGAVVGNVTGNVVGDLTGTATNATNAVYSTTRSAGTSDTTIATTEFVTNAIANSRPRTMTVSGPVPNTSSPDTQYIDLIQAYLPANTVSSGAEFTLVVQALSATSSSSFSAARWILAYRWATASVTTSTNLLLSSSAYKLIYRSNGSTWSYNRYGGAV